MNFAPKRICLGAIIFLLVICILPCNTRHIGYNSDNQYDLLLNESGGSGVDLTVGDNPIDQSFKQALKMDMSTPVLNYMMEKYMLAWKAEMANAAAVLQQRYFFEEDKACVKEYVDCYEKVAIAAGKVEWINWSDKNDEPKGRRFGTGAASGKLVAEANIYKQATLNLIAACRGSEGEKEFQYNYLYADGVPAIPKR